MLVGMVSGLSAALCQSLSYLGTRHYAHGRSGGAGRGLMVLGHVWMGGLAVIVLACAWPRGLTGGQWTWLCKVWLPVAAMGGAYLVGQVGQILALRHLEPSRVSPLLGVKVVFVALLSTIVVPPPVRAMGGAAVGLTWMQWTGVVLAAVAAVGLNFAGSALKKRAMGGILLACVAFSLSDWSIWWGNSAIKEALPGFSEVRLSFLNAALCYIMTAVPALVLMPWWGSRKGKDWRDAVPFAVTWFGGMLFLFWCFAEVGPVLGVILQATRGLMSIGIGALLLWWGHVHMEPASSRRAWVQRVVAGVLMFLAISLYVIKEPGRINMGWWHW
jgi:hypothetical protein